MYALTGKSLNIRQFISYSYPELRLLTATLPFSSTDEDIKFHDDLQSF
jgi:hypothetical protein